MKLLTLYNKNVSVSYKHSICSFASFFTVVVTVFTVVVPFYVVLYVNGDLWMQPKFVNEYPKIAFQYRFLMINEHSSGTLGGNDQSDPTQLVMASSFGGFNQITEKFQQSTMIKFWSLDFNYDGLIDQMNFQLSYESPNYSPLQRINLFLELEAIVEDYHCHLQIPAAIILQKIPIPAEFSAGEIQFYGQMALDQRVTFTCPFFMRNTKSIFSNQLLNANSTDLRDYQFAKINQKLIENPGYLKFQQTSTMQWTKHNQHQIQIKLTVNINEILIRFYTTFWQKFQQIWMQYLSILICFIYGCDQLKMFMFGKQIIRAWEIIPWKKLY